jgi:hypothetical protein
MPVDPQTAAAACGVALGTHSAKRLKTPAQAKPATTTAKSEL